MNWLKNLLGRVYVAYALTLFIVTMLIMLVPMWLISLLPSPLKNRCFVSLGRAWMKVYMPVVGCPVFTRGIQHIKTGGPYVVVCNHNSFADVPATYAALPGTHKSLAKHEMARVPLFGMMYRIGSVLVDRKDAASRKHSFVEMKEVLHQGMHMLLYPEGTRNKTDQPLKFFYDGAFSLAIDTHTPILPVIIRNTRNILPPGKIFYAWPHRIDMEFLLPVPTSHLNMDQIEQLKEQVFQIMWKHIENNA